MAKAGAQSKIRDRIKDFRRVRAGDLAPNPRNWRRHPDAQRKALMGVLEEIGYAGACLAREVRGKLELVDGHLRQSLDPEQMLPVLVLDVTKDEADKLLATFDPLSGMAEADEVAIAALIRDIEFSNADAAELLQSISDEHSQYPEEVVEDQAPALADAATTQPGDLWILGSHRLLCGDSSVPADLDRLLDGAKIQLVNTDPPYNVNAQPRSSAAMAAGNSNYAPSKTGKASKEKPTQLKAKDRTLANDVMSDADFQAMLLAWFGNLARVLEPGRAFYVWGGYANCANYPAAMTQCGLHFAQAIIWVKQHPVISRKDFMGNHEWAFHGANVGVSAGNSAGKVGGGAQEVRQTGTRCGFAGRCCGHLRRRVLWLARGCGSQILRSGQRARRVDRQEGQLAEDGALDREAGRVGLAGDGLFIPPRRERARPIRRQRFHANGRRTNGPQRVSDRARHVVLRRDRPAVGGLHGQEGQASKGH